MAAASNQKDPAAAQFSRPLRLSFRDDMRSTLAAFLVRAFLLAVTACSVLAVLLIFIFVIRQAAPFFTEPGVSAVGRLKEFLISPRWFPEHPAAPEYGALAIIVGSLYVTLTSLLIAVPTGLLAAVFLSDIASFSVRQICKPIIEILAAIPSVAYGVFAVMLVAPWLQQHLGFSTGTNALNASLILSIMAMPTIISVAEDALSAVGRDIREASYGLGATRAETMLRVVIPAAHSGILAAVILGMMRAVGETMVVWMASGNAAQIPSPWWDLSQSVRTMTATIAGELGEVPKETAHFHSLFAVGLLLLVFTFCLNLVSEYLMAQMKRIAGR
ncbi:MAG TPA: phosphate ABC transporter permease subunit PstC [Anaerohalosphaeraceae bacterium]|nr:phosphate ABC transporter permease subunit PstC [Anaerohalosphaeraceae bacterium]HQG06130.1 phosphate ABC transporter permease subunit PstC [Anaerohalosphaeraceae bacterium]HQI06574.1 phosphate ABC transporter permease subunit PstC [Anaerohalosphaeraceae bacterium]HQJ68015.1 phosphate ABC transporter permease subunit PstC [Anaerohalosphaeraceae bacterium]